MADQHHEDDVAQALNLATAMPVVGSPEGPVHDPVEAVVLECTEKLECSSSGRVEPSAAGQQPAASGEEPPKHSGSDVPSGAASTSAASSPVAGTSGARKRASASMTSSSSSSELPVGSRSPAPEENEHSINVHDSGSELSSSDDDDDAVIAPSPLMGKYARELALAEEEENMQLERLVDLNAGPPSVKEAYAVMQDVHDEEWIRYVRGQLQGECVEMSVDVEGDEVSPQDVEAEAVVSAAASARAASPRVASPPASSAADAFSWSDDFSNFTGQAETYLRAPGPQFQSHDPTEIFLRVWDRPIIEMIVTETNRYAWQALMSELSETGKVSDHLSRWRDTNVEEIYTLFAILIYMSLCLRTKLREYWTTGDLGMPGFRKLMSRHRFEMLTRFLHFANNEDMPLGLSKYHKKMFKISPLLNHCNNVFPCLYTPQRELSLDESLLLWKGNLSWVQTIRTKVARSGIKSYDLCEGTTGYLLRTLVYAGKESSMHPASIYGFENVTAKVVLEVMVGFLDLGHSLYMDNWYNQLPLTRYLKSRATDVIGTISRSRLHVPLKIKSLNDRMLARGQQVAIHCGDITLISWNDVKLVTTISTFHDDQQVPAHRGGQDVSKPLLIHDYNKYMGGVDRKDQMLSMFLIERKRKKKWYIKVFHRLLNTSLLNTHIIHRLNPMHRVSSHRDVRFSVAQGLFDRFCPSPVERETTRTFTLAPPVELRLDEHPDHRPIPAVLIGTSKRKKQARCQRCLALGVRTSVSVLCFRCAVPLCIGQCWLEYHRLHNLKR